MMLQGRKVTFEEVLVWATDLLEAFRLGLEDRTKFLIGIFAGAPGIGKSRALTELVRSLRALLQEKHRDGSISKLEAELLGKLEHTVEILVTYGNGSLIGDFDSIVGSEAALALRVLHVYFLGKARYTWVDFTTKIVKRDACQLSLQLALHVILLDRKEHNIPTTFLFLGIDEFTKLLGVRDRKIELPEDLQMKKIEQERRAEEEVTPIDKKRKKEAENVNAPKKPKTSTGAKQNPKTSSATTPASDTNMDETDLETDFDTEPEKDQKSKRFFLKVQVLRIGALLINGVHLHPSDSKVFCLGAFAGTSVTDISAVIAESSHPHQAFTMPLLEPEDYTEIVKNIPWLYPFLSCRTFFAVLGDVGPVPRCLEMFLERLLAVVDVSSTITPDLVDFHNLFEHTMEKLKKLYGTDRLIPEAKAIICATLLRLPIVPSAPVSSQYRTTWYELEQNGRLWIEVANNCFCLMYL